ncbi:MAG TPA: magnesium transporter, partial [Phycisphaerae bacterium]|nr:magnesium transporter [Phycisphaerae bacterium]
MIQIELEELIRDKKWDELREVLSGLDVADIAEIIVDLPPEDEGFIFRVLPRERAALAFSHLPLDQQEELIGSLSSETSAAILDGMSPDDRARLLDEMPAEVTRRLVDRLSPDQQKATRRILNYPDQTAGRYMTPAYVALRPDMTAREALDHVRSAGAGKETLNILYVVENGKLVSEIRLGTLVMAAPDTLIRDIKDRLVIAVPATADRKTMIETFEKYDRAALPVTDQQGNMLGIITSDDVLDVAEEVTTEEIQKMGGTEALDAPYLSVSFWHMVRKRGGWLAILFLGEMLTATAMGFFEGEIEKAAVVALFVPLIISSGGNSGSQGTSLIIRSLAIREVKLADWWRVFGRELRTGLALGFFLGLIGFMRIGAWQALSQAPVVGGFFRTHSGAASAVIPDGMKMAKYELPIKDPLAIPAMTIPEKAVVAKGQLIPEDIFVPVLNDKDEVVIDKNTNKPLDAFIHAGTDRKPSAYGEFWFRIGLTVFCALIGVVAWGSLAGSMLPFILRRLGF